MRRAADRLGQHPGSGRGVRRIGKSTLCYQTLRDKGAKYAYANFDDEQLIGLKASDLNDVLEVLYKIYGECDFVVCQGDKVLQCIQVSHDISVKKTHKRKVACAVLAAERTHCENLLLLTDHESDAINERGHIIKVQPVYEWALELGVQSESKNIC